MAGDLVGGGAVGVGGGPAEKRQHADQRQPARLRPRGEPRRARSCGRSTANDLPGIPLHTVQEVTRLANGNTLINNWAGGVPPNHWPAVVQLIEVTPDKRVVWALRDWTTLGPASSTHLLDEPGVAEKGELQR